MECVKIGNATLYNGDCLQVLQSMETASIDALITDPLTQAEVLRGLTVLAIRILSI